MTIEWILIGLLGAGVVVLGARLFVMRRRWRRAQARAQNLRARLREAFDRPPDFTGAEVIGTAAYNALLLIDGDREVIHINPAGRSLFGAETLGPGLTVMAVTRHHELDDLAAEALRADEMVERQVEIQGRPYRARAMAAVRGGARYAGLALEDVGELQRLGRARRDMVANVSHELRTPITSIRLLVDTLLRGEGPKGPQRTELLTKIAAETDSLQQIAQELLDLAQIESGRAEMRLVPVALKVISGRAVAHLSEQLGRKSLAVTDAIPDDLRALADGDQVERALVNVLHNALKFTPEGGQITLDGSVNEDWITVTVTDSGPGIPPTERERIFERFYRADRARSRGGTGLGLAITKHIIAAHGGRVWAESGPGGQGARLCLTLPTVDEG